MFQQRLARSMGLAQLSVWMTLVSCAETTSKAHNPIVNSHYGELPLTFEANQGQATDSVKFLSRGSGYSLFLNATEAVLWLTKPQSAAKAGKPDFRGDSEAPRNQAAVLRMQLVGANPTPEVAGLDEQPGTSNYFIGNDRKRWRTNIPTFAKVQYTDVYPGVDLLFYGNQHQVEYDFVVAPGVDPSSIRLAFSGADRLTIDPRGNLVIDAAGTEVVLQAPRIYQEIKGPEPGFRQEIEGRYVFNGDHHMGFQMGEYDPRLALVIDPVLVYSTYLGGGDVDQGLRIAVDTAGNAYVVGSTRSVDFPTENAIQPDLMVGGGIEDVFVTKLNAAGTALVYSTYLGGTDHDSPGNIAVDSAGNAYVAGGTASPDFPTVNPFQALHQAGDAFVTKIAAAGDALVYSTYLGGIQGEWGNAIAVDSTGNAYVTGRTDSESDFPTANPFQSMRTLVDSTSDAFVTKFTADGSSLVFSTYLGKGNYDEGFSIVVDAGGNAYVAGATRSSNFYTLNPLQVTCGSCATGLEDTFLTKFSADGTALVYSTFLGGNGIDFPGDIALDSRGNTYLVGLTRSTNFPTARPIQATNGGNLDAFVTKVGSAGNVFIYSTYLGASNDDQALDITLDIAGNAYIAGATTSADFPIATPLQANFGGGISDGFVSKLNPAGSVLDFSTYIGGSEYDDARGIAIDSAKNVYVTGQTLSTDFPTANPLQPSSGGGPDAFVAKIGTRRMRR